MAIDIIFPKLGFSMTEGVLVSWNAEDGATVTEGDHVYSLEGDKATQDVEAPASGTLRILVQAGDDDIAVGTVIGRIE